MNFPHTSRERATRKKGADAPPQLVDPDILREQAIARQAASHSAQVFVAASQFEQEGKETPPSSFMDDRIAFFAGRFRSDAAGREETILFRTGCFRPDLARQEFNNMHG